MADPRLVIRHRALSLSLSTGEAVLLSGEVGSGKTRWLRMLAGLETADDSFAMHYDGKPWPDDGDTFAVRLHADCWPCLWFGQSIREELAFGLPAVPDGNAMQALLSQWRLDHLSPDTHPGALNRTESVRLSLAAMELAQPRLVLIDNPVAALTVTDARQLQRDILAWLERARCMMVVACNRWQDWPDGSMRRWHIAEKGAWPAPGGSE